MLKVRLSKIKNIISILLFQIIFFACGGDSIEYQKAIEEEASIKPDQLANFIKVNFYEDTWHKAILTADRAEIYFESQQTQLIGNVVVEYFSQYTGRRLSKLNADKATVDDNSKDMVAMGNVVVWSDSAKVKLETSKLQWSNEKQIVFTNEFIKVTTPTEIINGYGFESNLSFSYYKILKVSGIKQ